jgi:hypothetical protein
MQFSLRSTVRLMFLEKTVWFGTCLRTFRRTCRLHFRGRRWRLYFISKLHKIYKITRRYIRKTLKAYLILFVYINPLSWVRHAVWLESAINAYINEETVKMKDRESCEKEVKLYFTQKTREDWRRIEDLFEGKCSGCGLENRH